MIYLFIVYSLLFIVLAVCRPKWALFLLCFGLPAYQLRFKILGLPTTALEAMILILFGVILIKRIKNKDWKLGLGNWKFLILAWLAVGLISVFVSPAGWQALGHWRAYFLEPLLFLIILLSLVKEKKDIRLVLFGLSLSALVMAGWAIYQKIIGSGMKSLEEWQYPLRFIYRPTGFFPHSNFLGLFLGPIIILAFGQFINSLKLKKLLFVICYLLTVVSGILALIFARSEGAILGVTAGLIFLIFFCLKKKQKIIFLLGLVVVGCLLLVVSSRQSYFWRKISFDDLSLQMRLNIWRGTLDLLKDHPFFGAGLRGYQKLISQYQKPFYLPGTQELVSQELHPYPHNLFLALWVELGLLGLIIFISILVNFFQQGFKLLKNKVYSLRFTVYSLIAAMVAFIVHGLVDTPYFKNDLSILFWLIVGLIIIKSSSLVENKNS